MTAKRLYRSRKNKIFGGVCGGLGNYFHCDPTIIRVIALILSLLLAVIGGILCYLILWIVIPEEPERKRRKRKRHRNRQARTEPPQ